MCVANSKRSTEKYGNKLMRARVALQGVAIVLFLLFVFAASQSS